MLYENNTLHRVEFRLPGKMAPQARHVCLVASFNRWDPYAHELSRGPDGDWTITVALPQGVYPYLYYADSAWYNDPGDDGRTPTGWGNEYSLKRVA